MNPFYETFFCVRAYVSRSSPLQGLYNAYVSLSISAVSLPEFAISSTTTKDARFYNRRRRR